jgi:hypothetical protein
MPNFIVQHVIGNLHILKVLHIHRNCGFLSELQINRSVTVSR